MSSLRRAGAFVGVSIPLVFAASGQAPHCTDPSASWSAQVGDEIRASEYRWSPVGDGVWSAPNRGQELRCRVSSTGLEITPRDQSGAWTLRLATKSFGRRGSHEDLAAGALCTEGARAELAHGSLIEWFENRVNGIEQGWTIARAPAGDGPLWIGLEIQGGLSLCIEAGAHSGVLLDTGGEACLRYDDLLARDATGRALEARLESGPAGVGIRIDDAHAVYPLTVDPALTCPAWTAESDQAARFGASVSSAGDVNGDGYDDVIVGEPMFDHGETNEGQSLLYLGSSTGLSNFAAWTAESDVSNSLFGTSVAGAGDVNGDGFSDVLIGAPAYLQTDKGRAYLYLGSATGLAATPAWTVETSQAGTEFGASVSSAGDVNGDGFGDVIVGAYAFDHPETDEGRAFVFLGSASGLSIAPAWTAESDQADALFGVSVATAGDVNGDGYDDVIVGASAFPNGQHFAGRVYLYLGSSAGLATTAAWTVLGDPNQHAQLGCAVASAGDVNGDGFSDVIVGAQAFSNGQDNEGRAYVYLGSATGLAALPAWTAESDQADARFGAAVATAGDVNGDGFDDVIVGAPQFSNGEPFEGRVYAYLGSASGLSPTAAWTAEGNTQVVNFGISLATAGDVNGDGYRDVIVGAPDFTKGRAEVYLGSALGLSRSLAYPGDGINADVIAPVDVVVGSTWSAPLTIGHPHGTSGPLALRVRGATVNGPNFPSPVGGRLTEVLIGGPLLSAVIGTHNGVSGDIPPQPVPNQAALVGLSWAAQYTVAGGGFADLSQAVFGVIDSCP